MKRSVVHRRGTPKSQNGCLTCKIRRIKCDETRPSCLRCSNTGRDCDGYAAASRNTQRRNTKLLSPSRALSAADCLPASTLERRSFDFFRSRTVVDIAGHFDSPLWSKLVLQASHSEPAVQYATTALGAVHEKIEYQRSIGHLAGQSKRIDMDFPIRQYTEALVSIRNLLDRPDTRSIELVLISCLICIYYEVLQENYPAAWTHLEKALKVLKPTWRTCQNWPASKVFYYPVKLITVDENLIQAFARLDVQASSYMSHRAPRLLTVILPADIPARFASLNQAREALNGITGQIQYSMWYTATEVKNRSPASNPPSALTEVHTLKLLLETWAASYSAFTHHPSTTLTPREQRGSKVLHIQHRVAHIKTATCLSADPSIYDQFDTAFTEILSHAESLLANIDDDRGDGPQRRRRPRDPPYTPPPLPLSMDAAIIEALFGTAIKSRSLPIRVRAAALLRKVPWREGVWDASLLASIADRFISAAAISPSPSLTTTSAATTGTPAAASATTAGVAEAAEQGNEILDHHNPNGRSSSGSEARAPEFWRARTVAFTVDWTTCRVKLFCNLRLQGREAARWKGSTDFLVW